jgi:hypothetical protein
MYPKGREYPPDGHCDILKVLNVQIGSDVMVSAEVQLEFLIIHESLGGLLTPQV